MRRLALFATLMLSACATAPDPPPAPVAVSAPVPQVRSDVLGMTAAELIDRFGIPALQIREGSGTKFQFRNQACVLDAYVYPPLDARGTEKVVHVDTRNRGGNEVDQRSCIAAFRKV
ncbi:hypothetical protein [Sphingomonas sp.]|uniref:hypothetical protein n=1 Tax=Sphingomonas sp. TaxID=28214 RepID=UPI00286E6176|nr:hypothetical protein [Sphingomonas sp.]